MKAKIVFMGTPDFSVPALKALHSRGHLIPLVITQPDRPQGRGRKMIPTPVKSAALEIGSKVIQPDAINEDEILAEIKNIDPDFFVVVAFGQFLSEQMLAIPKYSPINIHASLLPKYRGSAPIHRAIVNGETKTGIATMFMDKGMDTGDILLMAEEIIKPDDTAESLHDRLAELGADLILKTIDKFLDKNISRIPQIASEASYAPMLSKKEGLINWEKTAKELDCFVRGMTPWPGAYTFIENKRLKVFKVKQIDQLSDKSPGMILESRPDELFIATGNGGVLSIIEIQGASGKKLGIADFLRGFKVESGTVIGHQ